MKTSESIKNIAIALIAFHKELQPVKKGETNPFFKSKYADLPAILEAIEKPLEKSGLSFVQFPEGENYLCTMLMHTTGEWMTSSVKMTLSKQDAQGFGSCITYYRRYALGSILGISTEKDDDGEGSFVRPKKEEKQISKPMKSGEEDEPPFP